MRSEIKASKVKVSHPVEYQEINGIKYLLLKRDWSKGKKGNIPKTEKCPFCGGKHIHGGLDGHRVAHCGSPPILTCVADDGSILNNDHGYILVDVSKNIE